MAATAAEIIRGPQESQSMLSEQNGINTKTSQLQANQIDPLKVALGPSQIFIRDSIGKQYFPQPSGPEDIKCSATHTLERDMPQFDYSPLIKKLRQSVLEDHSQNPGIYSQKDIEKLTIDDWTVARYLLRHKLDFDLAFDMIRKSMRFRNESLCLTMRREDFPKEFFLLGGLFGYEQDRKGNKMLYLRVKIHRKVPEISAVLQAFIFYQLQSLDAEADGKGISIVFDCTGGGIANADMDMLLFVFHTLNNYFPKGLSYILVHELPWILKPFWYIAKNWIPEDKRELIKFSDSRTIYEYVDREKLPDFMGGTCERNYRAPPENCTTLEQASKLWGIGMGTVRKVLTKFAEYLPEESLGVLDTYDADDSNDEQCPSINSSSNSDVAIDNDTNKSSNNNETMSHDSDQENKF